MTVIQLILMQLVAHLVADFYLQSESFCAKKEAGIFSKQHVYHVIIVTIAAYVFSLNKCFCVSALIIGLSHWTIDTIKTYLTKKRQDIKSIVFFVDQGLHLLVISLVSWVYLRNYSPSYFFEFSLNTKLIAVIAAFLFCGKPANIFIRFIIDGFGLTLTKKSSGEIDPIAEKELENAGKLIGIAERYMALGLMLAGQFAAVGFIITAKSILRFNSPQKNEYILVGTLLSFGFAILIGLFITHFLVSVK